MLQHVGPRLVEEKEFFEPCMAYARATNSTAVLASILDEANQPVKSWHINEPLADYPHILWSDDASRAALETLHKTTRTWHTTLYNCLTGTPLAGPVPGVPKIINNDGSMLVTSDKIYRAGATDPTMGTSNHGFSALSRDGSLVASTIYVDEDHYTEIWDTKSDKQITSLVPGRFAAFSADKTYFATMKDCCKHTFIYRVKDGQRQAAFPEHCFRAFSPDGAICVLTKFNREVFVYQTSNGQQILGPIEGAFEALSDDGPLLIIQEYAPACVVIYHIPSRQEIARFPEYFYRNISVDGLTLALMPSMKLTGNFQSSITLFSIADKHEFFTVPPDINAREDPTTHIMGPPPGS